VALRAIVNAVRLIPELTCAVLAAYALVGVGIRGGRSKRRRLWGQFATAPRPIVAAYFTAFWLSLAWIFHVTVFLSDRPDWPFSIIGPAITNLTLGLGWLVARRPSAEAATGTLQPAAPQRTNDPQHPKP
jgi:hypothetical protein